jgi:hypothetical protein
LRLIRWVNGPPFAQLASKPLDPKGVQVVSDYLLRQRGTQGTLSVYRCETQAKLELVAIARSLNVNEGSFNYIVIEDDALVGGLRATHTPHLSLLNSAVSHLHYSLVLPDQDGPALAEYLWRKWAAKIPRPPTIYDTIKKADLKALGKSPSFSCFVPAGHWLTGGKPSP